MGWGHIQSSGCLQVCPVFTSFWVLLCLFCSCTCSTFQDVWGGLGLLQSLLYICTAFHHLGYMENLPSPPNLPWLCHLMVLSVESLSSPPVHCFSQTGPQLQFSWAIGPSYVPAAEIITVIHHALKGLSILSLLIFGTT